MPPPPVAGAAAGAAVPPLAVAGASEAGAGEAGPPAPAAAPDDAGAAAALLAEVAGVCGLDAPGENEDDPAEGVVADDEQAESAAEVTMAMEPQPMTVSTALSPVPAMVVRSFMAITGISGYANGAPRGRREEGRHWAMWSGGV
ncbi:MAG TPA: hypothetical protein VLW50_31035 [Streptosporangiaceae bacterium]|nr:hypothetical protein [Streptosporangiaceae bacterium]